MKKNKHIIFAINLLLIIIVNILPQNASGTTRYVQPDVWDGDYCLESGVVCASACAGYGGSNCYYPTNPTTTKRRIIDAINESGVGDTVIFMPGTFYGGNGTGGSIWPTQESCSGMSNMVIRGFKTVDDTGTWRADKVIVEFSDDTNNRGFGITTRNTDGECIAWWEQNHGQAVDGWTIQGFTLQKAKDYFRIMTGIYVAGQGEISHSNERFYDAGSVNVTIDNCILKGFDLGIDVAHRFLPIRNQI